MSLARPTTQQLDRLIDETTADCHNEDEQLMGFENAFDEHAGFPCPGTVVGEAVEVLHVGRADGRHELIATCQRAGKRYEIALLDVDIHAGADTARLLAAYQRWTALALAAA